jgi:hypothetical protein
VAEYPPLKPATRELEVFTQYLCRALDGWQREWGDLEARKEQLDAVLKSAYDLCDALGIVPSANPGIHQMTFYRGKKIIYGYRPTRKQRAAWKARKGPPWEPAEK